MTILLMIFITAFVIVLFLFILQSHEIKSISNQLDRILKNDTNELLHSESNIISHELINKINNLLKTVNNAKMLYNRKNHEIEQMITNISHDLRTPLTSAMGYINIILNSDITADEKEREIRIVEQRLARLEELINSFFEFSKVISGSEKYEVEKVNIIGVLQESIVHYFDDFSAQNREIVFECDTSKIMINSNKNMLMRIFDNLIGNAYKHSSGELYITVSHMDRICINFKNKTEFAVDTSCVFNEFYTTDISRTKENTGLGLAIAKQFTELLSGKISAEYDDSLFCIHVIF